jgi:hypothetical protein
MIKSTTLIIVFLFTFSIAKSNETNPPKHTDNVEFGGKKIDFGCSESDAEIYINGKLLGKGSLEITVPNKDCITVIVKKTGFLTEKIEFCNKKGMPVPPKSYYMELDSDDAYAASVQTDIANIDIELKCTISKDKAWKLINQIVLSYIDVIEMTDKETGYLRTSWALKTFQQNTIRTRIIIKEASESPLVFKVKLVSEESNSPLTSVKRDELYREWDRVLRSYSNVIPEFQARLK